MEMNTYRQENGNHICASCRRSGGTTTDIEFSTLIASVHELHPDHAGFGSVRQYALPYCPVCNPLDAATSRTCIPDSFSDDSGWASFTPPASLPWWKRIWPDRLTVVVSIVGSVAIVAALFITGVLWK